MVREELWICDQTGKEVKGKRPDDWISISPNSIFFGSEMSSPIDKFYTFSSVKAFKKWLKSVQKKMIKLMKKRKKLKEKKKKEKKNSKGTFKYETTMGDIVAST